MRKYLIWGAAALALSACSEPHEPASSQAPAATTQPPVEDGQEIAPVQEEPAAEQAATIDIEAPSGQYTMDPYHNALYFSVTHLGVSNYVMRFTDFEVTLNLDTDDLAASSVEASINALSIATDFSGDFPGTHPDSPFATWEENLARNPDFLNADEHPSIRFTSTSVEPSGEGTLIVNGDLELRGVIKPVTLEARVVGSAEAHPFTGAGLIGFSATGNFNRSDFGLTHLVNPPIVGDTVTLHFEGEFLQQDATAEPEEGVEAEEEQIE
ncbi:MAG TPA: YceI family protein [Porticoccaceae bacterium]